MGVSGSVVRAAPPLKHREGQSVRGRASGAAEGAQERWTGEGGGAVEEVLEGLVLTSGVWEAERRVGWIKEAAVRGIRRPLRGAVLPRSARVAQVTSGATERARFCAPEVHRCFRGTSALLPPNCPERTQNYLDT